VPSLASGWAAAGTARDRAIKHRFYRTPLATLHRGPGLTMAGPRRHGVVCGLAGFWLTGASRLIQS